MQPQAYSYVPVSSHAQADGGSLRRQASQTTQAPITRNVPAWLTVRNGRFHIIPEKADAIQTLYGKTAEGWSALGLSKGDEPPEDRPREEVKNWRSLRMWLITL